MPTLPERCINEGQGFMPVIGVSRSVKRLAKQTGLNVQLL